MIYVRDGIQARKQIGSEIKYSWMVASMQTGTRNQTYVIPHKEVEFK